MYYRECLDCIVYDFLGTYVYSLAMFEIWRKVQYNKSVMFCYTKIDDKTIPLNGP